LEQRSKQDLPQLDQHLLVGIERGQPRHQRLERRVIGGQQQRAAGITARAANCDGVA